MTLGAETKIYVVQIQAQRYYDPKVPWETVLVTHSYDEAVECADGIGSRTESSCGMQARVLRYYVQCCVMRTYRLTRGEEERAREVADAIARRNAARATECADDDGDDADEEADA